MPKDRVLPFRASQLSVTPNGTLPDLPLPEEITEDYVNCRNSVGLSFHVLESGRDARRPLILLLHEFPGLAYSWRKIMPSLASANNYVVAVDQRGYGRTTGWDNSTFGLANLDEFTMRQYVSDMVALVYALGYKSVRCVIGHDFGASVASMCALLRPDFFTTCVLISRPFKGFAPLPLRPGHEDTVETYPGAVAAEKRRLLGHARKRDDEIHFELARLDPSRKHFEWYNSCSDAAADWDNPPQGMRAFLRGYFHLKSADYAANRTQPLHSRTAEELAKMPTYYILPLNSTLPEVVALDMDTEEYEQTRYWLSDEELSVYVQEWSRTGFQGALNHYRVLTDPAQSMKESYLAGTRIEVPVVYLGGSRDWGSFADPGVLQAMPNFCKDFRGVKSIKDAGFWPQQEQPGAVVAEILLFLWNVDHPRQSSASQDGSPDPMGVSTGRKSTPRGETSLSSVARNKMSPPLSRINSSPGKDRTIASQSQHPSPDSPRRLWGKRGSESSGQSNLRNSSSSSAAPVAGYSTRSRSSSMQTDNQENSGYRSDHSIASTHRKKTAPDADSPHPDSLGFRQSPNFSAPKRANPSQAQVAPHDEVSERNAAVYEQVTEQVIRRRDDAERRSSSVGVGEGVLQQAQSEVRKENFGSDALARGGYEGVQGTYVTREKTPFDADMEVWPPTPGWRH